MSGSIHRPIKTIYRLRGDIPAGTESMESIFRKSVSAVWEFCREYFVDSLPGEYCPVSDSSHRGPSYLIDCKVIPEIFTWAMRLVFTDHSDSGEGNAEIYENRTWYYDIGFAEQDGALQFGIEVGVEQNSISTLVDFSPQIVGYLGEKVGLRQVRVLDGRPMQIRNQAHAEQLHELLNSRLRHLPVVVISEVHSNSWLLTPNPPSYLLDISVIASRLHGYAHVVQMTRDGSWEWSQLMGNLWPVYDGAVRIFRSNFDPNYGSSSEHPAFLKDEIWDFRHDRANGPRAFFNYLLGAVRRNAHHSFTGWRGLLFYNGLSIGKEILAKINTSGQIQEAAKREERLTAQKLKLEKALALEKEKSKTLTAELGSLTERNRDQEAVIASMQRSIERLSGYEKAPLPLEELGEIEIPDNFEVLPVWVQLYLAGRLYLHPRAERAIEKAEYKNPELVYGALLALAFEYRDSKLGLINEKPFKAKCSQLRIQKRASITKSRAGQEGDQYFVNYPFHTSNRCLLQWHLAKGNSRQKAYCMRIYYFWDEESKQVIVGYLPGHLSTRQS